jgi:membrane protease subunit HflK
MPWNEPGQNGKDNGGKNNDPWGGQSGRSNPPDLDKMLGDFAKKIRQFFTGKNSKPGKPWGAQFSSKDHHYGIGAALIAVLVIWILSGLFIVNPAEEAVILRLGKYADVAQPGLHWMARFIDKKYLVDVQKIHSFALQGDFLTKSSDQSDMPGQYIQVATKNIVSDQSKNLVNVELNVQYRITDPRAYLFNIVNPDETVKEVASSALSEVIGKMKLDEVLTTGRESLSNGVLDHTRAALQSYDAGIEVLSVTLRKVQAPDQVRAAFSDVNRADQDKATYIQQAQAYASKIVPLAQGFAARTLADANAYQQKVVLTAQANIAKYIALSRVYAVSPEVTRERMYLETMEGILSRTTKVLIDFNTSNNMLYLPLDKLLKSDTAPPPPEDLMKNSALAAQNSQNLTATDAPLANNVGVTNDSN